MSTLGSDYVASLESALVGSGNSVLGAFHMVRNLRYASRGNRDPAKALALGEGACTAKHILLRDLLRMLGEPAYVEIVEGDFAANIPAHPSMPDTLRTAMSKGIRDFHNVTLWRGERLDATWPDVLMRYGFTVNAHWAGAGSTWVAVADPISHGTHEDVVDKKAALIAGMETGERQARSTFLALLTSWLDNAQKDEPLRSAQ